MTQWKHFKENYLGSFIFCIVLFLGILTIELIIGSNDWRLSFIFLLVALIFPVGNYFSWKKKFK